MESVKIVKPQIYKGIDIFKGIMALLVVAIHVIPIPKDGNLFHTLFQSLLNCAVPYFFLVSGFLLAKKINRNPDQEKEIIFGFIKSSIKLYVCWTIIYLPLTFAGLSINNELNLKSALFTIKNIFFKGENFFSWPLWYLMTLVYFSIILYYMEKFKIKIITLIIISYLVYFLGTYLHFNDLDIVWVQKLNNLINVNFGGFRIVFGFLMTGLGMFLAKKSIYISAIHSIFIMIISLFATIIFPNYLTFHFIICAAISVLYIALYLNPKKIEDFSSLRKLSTIFYLTHMIFYFLLLYVFNWGFLAPVWLYLLTISCCLLLGFFIIKFYKKSQIVLLLFS